MSSSKLEQHETLLTLQAALREPDAASQAWRDLCSEISFMELSYRSIRLFPSIYKNLIHSTPEELGRLRGAYRRNWVKNQLAWFSYAPLLNTMTEERINYVMGKGFAVAAFLGDLGIRQMGDLDLYIHKSDRIRVHKLFSDYGFSDKFSSSCHHDSSDRVILHAGSYLNQNGHEIDVHFVDSGSDYLHRRLISDGQDFLAFGKHRCRIPRVELMLIKSLRHGEKQVSISDYVQSVWDVTHLLPFCDLNQLSTDIRKSGDGRSMNQMLDFLRNDIKMSMNDFEFRQTNFRLSRKLRNFQFRLLKIIQRMKSPFPLLRGKDQVARIGILWVIWRSLGALRPIERLVWRWRGGFLNEPKITFTPGQTMEIRSSPWVSCATPKGSGEIRFRVRANGKVSEIELLSVEHLTSNFHLFINGVLHGSIPIKGEDRYVYPLRTPEFEISIRNPRMSCSDCLESVHDIRFLVR